ncbi:AraC family transcriptional regulator [Actinoplanes sp. NBRC 14428]|uniref:AraC family transcriptional regulator n=1 Tax=Pseudosporangium ferrugineum TaxID=439699 RepID=A0A2T0RKK2_9ACTN|nr:AraC family transcriptional regulator [Pseudosporangium ferrugineum]PRY21650.1 AraC family transcriptional regulator [Pseudosporangium ferrugineum]BCJ49270.1 AraC family transcriptional regulator [Actinoplanes sp. NBRC 14428]
MDTAGAVDRDPGPATTDSDVAARAALRTTDVDEARAFCRRVFYGPLEVKPAGDTDAFHFAGDVTQIGPLTIGEVSYGVEICVAIGDLRTAYHVLAPVTGEVRVQHRGTSTTADPGRAAVFQPAGDIDLRWSADCRLFSVKVERLAFERELEAAHDAPGGSPLPLGATFGLAAGPGRSWMALTRLLHAELREPDGIAAQPWLLRRWRDLAISTLAGAVEHSSGDGATGRPTARRPRTVKRTLDAMHAEPGRSFTAAELAGIAGVGIRVLQDSFRRHVGVPPLTYLRRLRLEGVHAELTRADRGEVSVSEVAYRWGFTHLGRFAGAYRARYGVSPSQTLRGDRP